MTPKHIARLTSAATLLLCGSGLARAQAAPAPQAQSTAPAQATATAAPAATRTVATPARVSYTHAQLEVAADNASLLQTLGEIARLTGMKISGTVADERIFGNYGPGAPAKILASLLEGTGTNIFLTQSASGEPLELALTPRNGPATPPQPEAAFAQPAPPANPFFPGAPHRFPNGQPAPGTGPANSADAAAAADPSAAPGTPLTSAERALLINRLQNQQVQQQAAPH